MALEPRDLPGLAFLMGRPRPREAEQCVCRLRSDAGVGSPPSPSLRRWGRVSSFTGQCSFWVIGLGSGFLRRIKVADGLWTWQSLPGWASWKQGSWLHGAPQPGSSSLLPALWICRLLAGRACLRAEPWDLLHSRLPCGSLSLHSLSDSRLASLSLGGPSPPRVEGRRPDRYGQ